MQLQGRSSFLSWRSLVHSCKPAVELRRVKTVKVKLNCPEAHVESQGDTVADVRGRQGARVVAEPDDLALRGHLGVGQAVVVQEQRSLGSLVHDWPCTNSAARQVSGYIALGSCFCAQQLVV